MLLTWKQAARATYLQLFIEPLLGSHLPGDDHLSLLQLVLDLVQLVPLSLHMTHLLVQLLRAYMAPFITICSRHKLSECVRLSYV